MATLKQRVHRLNNEGTYDTIHYETSASCVIDSNGNTVEYILNTLWRNRSFVNYSLNGCNIDATEGNWTVALSESGHGTYPPCGTWCQVTQFYGDHFAFQIASNIQNSTSTTRTSRFFYREKYYIDSSAAWSAWTESFSMSNYTYSTTDLSAGSSSLATGHLYFVYE